VDKELVEDEELSNCCNEYIYENTDICSVCHEHCESVNFKEQEEVNHD